MVSNTHKSAAKTLAKKLAFEAALIKILHPHFKKVADQFAHSYSKNGQVINLAAHKKDIKNVLSSNYQKVASKFSSNLRSSFVKPDNNEHIQKRIDLKIQHNASVRSSKSSDDIGDTTHRNISSAVKKSIAVAIAAGVAYDHASIASQAKEMLLNSFDNRIPTISTTEVQYAAENAKSVEVEEMDAGDAVYGDKHFSDMTKTKVWVAVLDDKTRDWHADADGQEVDLDDSFDVGGDQMMEPGDDSLGAGADNLCNCRCSCEYKVEQ